MKSHAASLKTTGRLRHQAHDGKRGNTLAATRLADDADRLTLAEFEGHALHGSYNSRARVKRRTQVLYGEECISAARAACLTQSHRSPPSHAGAGSWSCPCTQSILSHLNVCLWHIIRSSTRT